MNTTLYKQNLGGNLKESVGQLGLGRHLFFQQDNDPKHMAKIIKKWLGIHKVKLLDWPSQRSLDYCIRSPQIHAECISTSFYVCMHVCHSHTDCFVCGEGGA